MNYPYQLYISQLYTNYTYNSYITISWYNMILGNAGFSPSSRDFHRGARSWPALCLPGGRDVPKSGASILLVGG